jgi:hypothetical protein
MTSARESVAQTSMLKNMSLPSTARSLLRRARPLTRIMEQRRAPEPERVSNGADAARPRRGAVREAASRRDDALD